MSLKRNDILPGDTSEKAQDYRRRNHLALVSERSRLLKQADAITKAIEAQPCRRCGRAECPKDCW